MSDPLFLSPSQQRDTAMRTVEIENPSRAPISGQMAQREITANSEGGLQAAPSLHRGDSSRRTNPTKKSEESHTRNTYVLDADSSVADALRVEAQAIAAVARDPKATLRGHGDAVKSMLDFISTKAEILDNGIQDLVAAPEPMTTAEAVTELLERNR